LWVSQDGDDPKGQHDNGQRERETDHFQGCIIPEASRQGRISSFGRGAERLTHTYAT
jgi:hypothetical protein